MKRSYQVVKIHFNPTFLCWYTVDITSLRGLFCCTGPMFVEVLGCRVGLCWTSLFSDRSINCIIRTSPVRAGARNQIISSFNAKLSEIQRQVQIFYHAIMEAYGVFISYHVVSKQSSHSISLRVSDETLRLYLFWLTKLSLNYINKQFRHLKHIYLVDKVL